MDERFKYKNYLIIPDIEKNFKGPLAGIYASMDWSKKNYPNKIKVPVYSTPDHGDELLKKFSTAGRVVVVSNV